MMTVMSFLPDTSLYSRKAPWYALLYHIMLPRPKNSQMMHFKSRDYAFALSLLMHNSLNMLFNHLNYNVSPLSGDAIWVSLPFCEIHCYKEKAPAHFHLPWTSTPQTPTPISSFFPLTLFISVNNEARKAMPLTAIGKMNTLSIAMVYACKTPSNWSGGVTRRMPVAPAAMMVAGSTPVVIFGICCTRPLEKMFCAIETARAPPSVLKKMERASVEAVSSRYSSRLPLSQELRGKR